MSSITLNSGSGGASLGTDQVSGTPNVDYQIVKIGYSATGVAPTQVDTTNRLPTSAAQSGTWNITNISGTVSLPTGAATAAKQPALGTAGTASTDVITVQGIASMTPLLVNASGNAVPVTDNSGSLTVDGTVGISGTVTVDSELTTADLDTGAGTDTRAVVGMVLAASGGGLLVGAANPMPISDNGGSVTVDGTVSITSNSSVNVAQVAGTTTDTNSGNKSAGTIRVVLATDQPQLTNKLLVTPDANSAVNCAQIAGTTTATGNGTASAGCQRVTIASDNTAFSVNASQAGTWTVQPGNTANTTPWLTTDTPATSGGLSKSAFVGAASNNKTQVKGSAGQLYFISVQNLAATPVYLKVFDATSANVTAGTTACDYQFMIPGNTAGAGIVLNIDKGIAHANGITVMLTAGIATTDNTSVSANNQVVTIGYK